MFNWLKRLFGIPVEEKALDMSDPDVQMQYVLNKCWNEGACFVEFDENGNVVEEELLEEEL